MGKLVILCYGYVMDITAKRFYKGDHIPSPYICERLNGGNDIPTMFLVGMPEGTKSLFIKINDYDAPNGQGKEGNYVFTHFASFCSYNEEKRISLNRPLAHLNDNINNEDILLDYNGPCPPVGVHR